MDIFEGGRNDVANHSTSLSSAPNYDFGVQSFGRFGNFGNFEASNFSNNNGNCSDSIFRSQQFRAAAEKLRDEVRARFDAKTRHGGSQLRVRRGGYGKKKETKVVVRCKTSYTGLFSFLAIPLLMGDIMIEFMNMIDINVEIMITTVTTTTATTMATEPNNNNNNNGGGGGGGSGPGNNNNNMNSRSLFGNSKWQPHKSSHLRQKTKGNQGRKRHELVELKSRLETMMREYLTRAGIIRDSKDGMIGTRNLRGVGSPDYIIGGNGTLSRPVGPPKTWDPKESRQLNRERRNNRVARSISTRELMEIYYDVQRLRLDAGNGQLVSILDLD